jgi:hypothetical protein
MQIRIIKSTDGHFCGMVLSGQTIQEALMPLAEHLGEFTDIKIIGTKITLRNSNYLIVAKIKD